MARSMLAWLEISEDLPRCRRVASEDGSSSQTPPGAFLRSRVTYPTKQQDHLGSKEKS